MHCVLSSCEVFFCSSFLIKILIIKRHLEGQFDVQVQCRDEHEWISKGPISIEPSFDFLHRLIRPSWTRSRPGSRRSTRTTSSSPSPTTNGPRPPNSNLPPCQNCEKTAFLSNLSEYFYRTRTEKEHFQNKKQQGLQSTSVQIKLFSHSSQEILFWTSFLFLPKSWACSFLMDSKGTLSSKTNIHTVLIIL